MLFYLWANRLAHYLNAGKGPYPRVKPEGQHPSLAQLVAWPSCSHPLCCPSHSAWMWRWPTVDAARTQGLCHSGEHQAEEISSFIKRLQANLLKFWPRGRHCLYYDDQKKIFPSSVLEEGILLPRSPKVVRYRHPWKGNAGQNCHK